MEECGELCVRRRCRISKLPILESWLGLGLCQDDGIGPTYFTWSSSYPSVISTTQIRCKSISLPGLQDCSHEGDRKQVISTGRIRSCMESYSHISNFSSKTPLSLCDCLQANDMGPQFTTTIMLSGSVNKTAPWIKQIHLNLTTS